MSGLRIEDLSAVSTIVTHKGCADGVAAALILRDVLPSAEIVWVQYGTAEHRELQARPGMLFCDMTPPPDRVREFVEAGAIVLDHHRGASELVEAFGERGVFADEAAEPGVSGAMLAYREAWSKIGRSTSWWVEQLAALAGIRDTWQRDDPRWREACAQAAALRFWPVDILLAGGIAKLGERLEIGEILLRRDEERDVRTIAEADRFTVGPLRVVAFDGLHTSDIADRLADEADLILGWHYHRDPKLGLRIEVSCRSRGSFSALGLAKAFGGGGHAQAAGFRVCVPHDASPYELLRRLVSDHINSLTGKLA